MKKKYVLFMVLVVSLVVLTGCAKSVGELTASDEYVGSVVTVKGTVDSSLKVGELSGYALVDANGDTIIVASDSLPAQGDSVRAKGTLEKGPLGIGYYIISQE